MFHVEQLYKTTNKSPLIGPLLIESPQNVPRGTIVQNHQQITINQPLLIGPPQNVPRGTIVQNHQQITVNQTSINQAFHGRYFEKPIFSFSE